MRRCKTLVFFVVHGIFKFLDNIYITEETELANRYAKLLITARGDELHKCGVQAEHHPKC